MLALVETAHAAEAISVKLHPYIVGEVFGVPLTSTTLMAWLVMFGLVLLAILLTRRLSLVPAKSQSVMELMIGGAYDYMVDVLESKKLASKYFPIVMTIFIFVLTLNWVGLFPGITAFGIYDDHHHLIPFFYPAATDLNITLAFALVAFFTIQVAGVTAIGFFKYAGKFINFSSPLAFAVGLIELVSEISRLISFSFRLFGNILAGKTLLLVITMMVPFFLPVPILAFEVFVGFIQAFVFAILTLFFIKIAVEEPAH